MGGTATKKLSFDQNYVRCPFHGSMLVKYVCCQTECAEDSMLMCEECVNKKDREHYRRHKSWVKSLDEFFQLVRSAKGDKVQQLRERKQKVMESVSEESKNLAFYVEQHRKSYREFVNTEIAII